MGDRTVYKHLSGRVRAALRGEIEEQVVCLATLEELEPTTLADIANDGGGVLLVGMDGEDDTEGGPGIRGCPVDAAALAVVAGAAGACLPPVRIEVVSENTARQAFLRIEVAAAEPGGELSRILVPAAVADELSVGLADLVAEIGALREEVAGLRRRVDETRAVVQPLAGKQEELQRTARDAVSRIRALARHLGADDKLVAWERRQLRSLLSAAIEVAGKRARPGDTDEVLQQVRKTWSRFTDWVSDEVVDTLQKDAGDLLRNAGGDDDPEADDSDR